MTQILDDIEIITDMDEAKREYPVLVEIIKYYLPALSKEDALIVLSLLTDICPHCHDGYRGCQCWNDD